MLYGAVHKIRWQLGGVKNWSKLLTDSIKKLPIWEREVSKIQKNLRRRLWMVSIAVKWVLIRMVYKGQLQINVHFRKICRLL